MTNPIPYGRQYIDDEDIQAVIETLKSDYLTTGPKIKEFEEAFAKVVGAKYAVAVSNGTAALHAAAFALDLKHGDEVITTPMTFAATSNAALYMGATPVFVDIDPETYNIDPAKIEAAITEKTKAIFPVHFTGQPCNMDLIRSIAAKHNLKIVEDAAHGLGAEYKGEKVGSIADLTTFSLHPVKHITTGEGGVITTNSETYYKRLKLFRSHGITREQEELTQDVGSWYYEQQDLGYNYRITDIQAALGISQLKKLDQFVARRKEIAAVYNEALNLHPLVRIPVQGEGTDSSWHLYMLWVDFEKAGISKKTFFEEMRKKNIFLNVHYIPVYKHPYYQQNGYSHVKCEHAEWAYEGFVSMPIYFSLSEEEQTYVINSFLQLIPNQ